MSSDQEKANYIERALPLLKRLVRVLRGEVQGDQERLLRLLRSYLYPVLEPNETVLSPEFEQRLQIWERTLLQLLGEPDPERKG